jgi:hypothetical protein
MWPPYLSCNYFERNAARVRYPQFRKQGLFVGSGLIEAGCRTLIATRLTRSGMFWTVRGANAVITVRFVDSGMSIPEIRR